MKISFIYLDKFSLTKIQKIKFRKIIRKISAEEDRKLSLVNIVLCSVDTIKDYNKNYLGHDYATDIITFHDVNIKGETEGELLISPATVEKNAVRFKSEFEEELFRVVIHGILHLCGYKDKTGKQKDFMRLKENQYLNIN